MTVTITQAISQLISGNRYGPLTTGVGVIVVALLIVLLVERAASDAYGGQRAAVRGRAFTAMIAPLIGMLGLIVILRLAQLLKAF
ncbi:MAG: hypothetical protein PHQ40_14590 [Anaerolineaceae bacterium]|nr:hypothetical protein [Anaerolineaceae bacterium]